MANPIPTTLARGSTGDNVSMLQRFLTRLGFGPLVDDGVFGPATGAAVRAYQGYRKLAADEVVGPKTWADVMGVTADQADAIAKARAPAPPPAQTGIAGFGADGWYTGGQVKRVPCPLRTGGTIHAGSVVVHTTDCTPGTMPVILRAWSAAQGNGACAHFMLGRQPATDPGAEIPDGGLAQMVPISRNGNHAGGARRLLDGTQDWNYHGWYVGTDGKPVHPNLVSVGIEIDCAGRLSTARGVFTHTDTGKIFPTAEVYVDPKGHAWHKVTDYQFSRLGELLDAIRGSGLFSAFGPEITLKTNGTYANNGAEDAIVKGSWLVGHWTLDPNNKTDPGPQVMDWMRARYGV